MITSINFMITSTITTPIAAVIGSPNANAITPDGKLAIILHVILFATLLDMLSAIISYIHHIKPQHLNHLLTILNQTVMLLV